MIRREIDWLLTLSRRVKMYGLMVVDGTLIVFSFYFAMVLRLESWDVPPKEVWLTVSVSFFIALISFHFFGLYRSVTRFITARSFKAIVYGSLLSAVAMFSISQFFELLVPRSVPGIYLVLLIGSVAAGRFSLRRFLRNSRLTGRLPIAIYGAGEAGRQLLYAVNQGREYNAIAFFDDDPHLHNTFIGDVFVYSPNQISSIIEEFSIKTVLLALPSASRARRRDIVQMIEQHQVEIKTIPGMADIVSGRASFAELLQVSPEDLLGRDPVPPQPDLMSQNIEGKVVLVTGAGGSIGSELCRQILKCNPSTLVLLEVSEYALYSISIELKESLAGNKTTLIEPVLGSVQHPRRVREIIHAFNVQTIFHAAAYKHVVLVEENVVEGFRNNVFGTLTVAEAALDLGVENFILVSTDKAVRPTNFMGASKRMSELICQALAETQGKTIFSMVRFGNVLGSSGSVIPRFKSQIQKGGPVTVTHREITRYFMTIPEAAQLVIQASSMAKGGDVFVLDMGQPVRILDLAQSMVRLYGLKPYIMEEGESAESTRGDIAIKIVGLNKGEKLYEELLIGNNPAGTQHPRIMTATEVFLSIDTLRPLLNRLHDACLAFNVPGIREIVQEMPLDYQGDDSDVHDLLWKAVQRRRAG